MTDTVIRIKPSEDFVTTPCIENICRRGLAYLEAGYPLHLTGIAGSGKTTLALHLAGILDRPVMLVCGDEEFGSSDLLGGNTGIISRRLVDNFVHSVMKTEESTKNVWVDERLTIACKNGYTLVYDEFSRSHAEANNVLLSVLQEGILSLPRKNNSGDYLKVHPDFRAVFTSNPDEYAGVYTPQSALLDRMITIKLEQYDPETEIAIVHAKTGLSAEDSGKIMDIVRTAKNGNGGAVTLRAGIAIGRILVYRKARISPDDPIMIETCTDVLGIGTNGDGVLRNILEKAIGVEADG